MTYEFFGQDLATIEPYFKIYVSRYDFNENCINNRCLPRYKTKLYYLLFTDLIN